MTFESRLDDVFEQVGGYPVSPDLFARVQRSIEEDRAHRRRVAVVIGGLAAGVAILAALVIATLSTDARGAPAMPLWAAEVIVTIISVAIVVGLGPLIRRFAASYVGQVFGVDGVVAKHFLDLLDVAYYLVFTGVILSGVRLAGLAVPVPVTRLSQDAAVWLGRLLLVMGVLHATTVFGLPVLGLLTASNRHRVRTGGSRPTGTEARRAEGLVRALLYGLLGAVLLGALLFALLVVGGLADS